MRNALVGLATVLVLAAALGVKHGGVQALGSGGDGSYTFMSHQPGNPSAPVTYSSCQPIRVELNLDGAKNRAMANGRPLPRCHP